MIPVFLLKAQTIDRKFYTTNSTVRTSVQSGNTLYLGGDFTQLGIQANRLARINSGNTKPDITFPLTRPEKSCLVNSNNPAIGCRR